ncbi:hypothetical protein [Nocardioides zeae]
MAKRKQHYANVDPDSLYVSIYCGAPSHAEDPWRIATLYADYDLPAWPDGSPRWSEVVGSYWRASGEVLTFDTAATRTALVVDRPETDASALDTPEARSRYRLACRPCGDVLTSRAEKLDPVLLRLRLAGISELSLSGLRAMLRST